MNIEKNLLNSSSQKPEDAIDQPENIAPENPKGIEKNEITTRKGTLTMIGDNLPGYQGSISAQGGEYHLNPLNPQRELKGARIGKSDILIINDDVDISDLKPGDEVEYQTKMFDCAKIGSSYHWDKKQRPVIISIKKIEK